MFFIQAAFLTERLITKQNSFQTGVDAAMFENILFNTLNGGLFTTSLGPFDFPHSYFSDHVNWNLFFIIPIYFIFPYMETLFCIQSVLLASPILLLYMICRDWQTFRFLPSVLYFFYLPVFWIGIFDIHFETAFIPLFLLFFHVEKTGNRKWKFISFLLCLFCKEEISSVFIVYSILEFRSDSKSSFLILSVSVIYFILSLLILSFSRPDAGLPYHLYRFMQIPQNQGLYIYLIYFLFIPFLFFPFLSKYVVLLFPYLAYSFISSSEVNKTPLTHHSFIAVPILFISFIDGFHKFQDYIKNRNKGGENVLKSKITSFDSKEESPSGKAAFSFKSFLHKVYTVPLLSLLLILLSIFLFFTEGPPSKKYSYGKNFMKRDIPEGALEFLKNYRKDEKIASNIPAVLSARKHLRLLDLQKTYADETLIIYTFEKRLDVSEFIQRHRLTHFPDFKFNDIIILKPFLEKKE